MTAAPAPGEAPWAPRQRVDHNKLVFEACLAAREYALGRHLLGIGATFMEARRRLELASQLRQQAAAAERSGVTIPRAELDTAIVNGTEPREFARPIFDRLAAAQVEVRSTHQAGVGPDASAAWRASVNRQNNA